MPKPTGRTNDADEPQESGEVPYSNTRLIRVLERADRARWDLMQTHLCRFEVST